MRLALQISGEFRLLHLCLPNLQKNLVDVFPSTEIDIFIHTWWRDDDDLGDTPYKTRYLYGHGTGLSIFKPRGYYLEKLDDVSFLNGKSRATVMFYSILRANEARKEYERLTETKYDIVMRYRTDCIFNESVFALVKPYLAEQKSFLCIPKPLRVPTADGPIHDDESDSICDWFAIGTPDTMDIYCSTYLTFQDFDVSIVPESMLAMQLKAHGINRETSLRRPPMDYFLVDSTGEIRGSPLTAGKESLKNPDQTEER